MFILVPQLVAISTSPNVRRSSCRYRYGVSDRLKNTANTELLYDRNPVGKDGGMEERANL